MMLPSILETLEIRNVLQMKMVKACNVFFLHCMHIPISCRDLWKNYDKKTQNFEHIRKGTYGKFYSELIG